MRNLFVLFALCLFMSACGFHKGDSSAVKTIDASLGNIKENQSVFTDYSFIRLETTDCCLLENVVKADLQSDAVYLLSSYGGTVYKYTRDGRYVWQLNRGNGPGELVFATDFFVDYQGRSIYVLDNYRELKVYSLEGKYIRTEHLPVLSFLFTRKSDSLLCFDSNLGRKSDFHLFMLQDGEVVMEGLRKRDGSRNVGYMPGNVFAFGQNDVVYIQHMLSDTIYSCSLRDRQVRPAYFIDTDGYSVNSHDIDFPDSRSFYQICKESNYVPGLASFSLWNHQLYLTMSHEGLPLYVVYNQDTGDSGVFTSLCTGFPNSFHCVGRSEEGIVYCYLMEELLEYAGQHISVNEDLKRLMETAGEDDNPVLVVFK